MWWEIDPDQGESIHAVWIGLTIFALIGILFIFKCAL